MTFSPIRRCDSTLTAVRGEPNDLPSHTTHPHVHFAIQPRAASSTLVTDTGRIAYLDRFQCLALCLRKESITSYFPLRGMFLRHYRRLHGRPDCILLTGSLASKETGGKFSFQPQLCRSCFPAWNMHDWGSVNNLTTLVEHV